MTRFHPYAPAAVAPLAALGIALLLRDPIQSVTPMPFIGAVAYTAWRARWRVASLAALVSAAMLAALFFAGPEGVGTPEVIRFGLFAAVSGAIIWLIEQVTVNRDLERRQAQQLLLQSEQLQEQAIELEVQTRELEETLQAEVRSENRYRLLFNAVQDGITLHRQDGQIVATNASARRILGLTEDQLMSRSHLDPAWRIVRQDGTPFPGSELPAAVALRSGEPQRNVVMGVERPDGTRRWLMVNANPRDDADENGRVAIVSFTDVSDLFESRQSLRETQAQLRQAQKMEAVGQLAGGIAHDFNNLLTVITAFTELLSLEIPSDSPRRADLNEISKASARAAELTRQLLAFSRKQVLRPRQLNVNETVASMSRMLERLIGDDVEVVTRLADDIDDISADPGQLEQVLANLAVNARDAMPQGGVLLIETSNVAIEAPRRFGDEVAVPAGAYVRLLVSDTGIGMNASVRERIFEPFFTTKDPGKGTGLGLSTVYGIVKQSGGHIWVESVPGAGARFELFFPRLEQQNLPELFRVTGEHGLPGTGGMILLVEDEESVRTATRRILQRSGYKVVDAANAQAALRLAEQHAGQIDLLLTDLVMPGMRGTDLAKQIVASHPHVRVMVMSGYSETTAAHHWRLPANVTRLEKPFSAGTLTRQIAQVLRSNGNVA